MTLRDLTPYELKLFQNRCRSEWETLRLATPNPDQLVPFAVYEKIWSGGLRAALAYTGTKLSPKEWLLSGGGGFEDGQDGIRAANFTGEGLLDMLQAYREYLVGK